MRASGAGETEMQAHTESGSRWAKVIKRREAAGTVGDPGCVRIHLPDKGVRLKRIYLSFCSPRLRHVKRAGQNRINCTVERCLILRLEQLCALTAILSLPMLNTNNKEVLR